MVGRLPFPPVLYMLRQSRAMQRRSLWPFSSKRDKPRTIASESSCLGRLFLARLVLQHPPEHYRVRAVSSTFVSWKALRMSQLRSLTSFLRDQAAAVCRLFFAEYPLHL